MSFLAILRFVPMWAWLLLGFIVGGGVFSQYRYIAGKQAVQAEWDAAVERGHAEIARLKAEAGKITVRVETRIVEREKIIREKADVIYRDRKIFVPADSGELPGGFRVFHDAAAANAIPDSAAIADAPPVAVTAVADTIAINYERCNLAYERVAGWEAWAFEQCLLAPTEGSVRACEALRRPVDTVQLDVVVPDVRVQLGALP